MGYIIYSITLSRQHTNNQTINSIEIIIADSAMHGNLITTPMVRGWISNNNTKIVGTPIKNLPLSDIENKILKNGFVEQVKLYPTYSGALKVELSQRRPTLRLLVNGYNEYVTKEGYIFEAPHFASLYVPVITGGYRPPFPNSYRGDIDNFYTLQSAKIGEQIADIEREKYPLYEQEKQNIEAQRELRRMFIKKGWFESQEAFDKRVRELRAKKERLRRLYRYRGEVIAQSVEKISQRQRRLMAKEKKLKKRCEEFTNLINFAHIVENDKFWSSEVVQIIASESQSGRIRVSLMVRSGDFEVVFGEVSNAEEVEARFDKLLNFYEDALRRVGWSKYQKINVEYKNQVVCK